MNVKYIKIQDSLFERNVSLDFGGAIFNLLVGRCEIYNSTFTANVAQSYGGAIHYAFNP